MAAILKFEIGQLFFTFGMESVDDTVLMASFLRFNLGIDAVKVNDNAATTGLKLSIGYPGHVQHALAGNRPWLLGMFVRKVNNLDKKTDDRSCVT